MDRLAAVATTVLSSNLFLPSSPSATSSLPQKYKPPPPLPHLLRSFLIFLANTIILLISTVISFLRLSSASISSSDEHFSGDAATAPAARALSQVLSAVQRVPAASRKYELIRLLAERLLDDNLRLGGGIGLHGLNRAALASALARTVCRLEGAVGATRDEAPAWAAVRRWVEKERSGGEGGQVAAEKLAAEAMWLAEKMAECGGAAEAVERWGAARGLATAALVAEPRLQVALVRVTVFLFKHINAKSTEPGKVSGDEEEEEEESVSQRRITMLTSWLPLLCRATNGSDSPILSSSEKAEMIKILESSIEKLSWEEQGQVLEIWLHHFTSSPDSDWPNLESCYIRWYSQSRKQFLK